MPSADTNGRRYNGRPAPEDGIPARLLVVDDDEGARAILRAILEFVPEFELAGEAVNGQDALAAAAACRPDVVLMDVNMPVLDGFGAAERLLELSAPPRVVLCTGEYDEAKWARAEALGVPIILKRDLDEALAATFASPRSSQPAAR